jgi:hypothetical protein
MAATKALRPSAPVRRFQRQEEEQRRRRVEREVREEIAAGLTTLEAVVHGIGKRGQGMPVEVVGRGERATDSVCREAVLEQEVVRSVLRVVEANEVVVVDGPEERRCSDPGCQGQADPEAALRHAARVSRQAQAASIIRVTRTLAQNRVPY